MLLLPFLLLPAVLAAPRQLKISDYSVKIENNTLTSIKATARSTGELNLSGLGLRGINRSAFSKVDNMKALNLDDNPLQRVPETVFSNLNSLEHLSLVNNNITDFTRAFVGLGNLKTLNISYNPVDTFGPGSLYGLSNSVHIFMKGWSHLNKICTTAFEADGWTPEEEAEKAREENSEEEHGRHARKVDVDDDDDNDDDEEPEDDDEDTDSTEDADESKPHVKICINQGKVTLVDYMWKGEVLSASCQRVKTDHCCTLHLDHLGITGFEKGWFRIKEIKSISRITFRNNSIARLTKEILNDLPGRIDNVDLSGNKIERLQAGVITNSAIHFLHLSNNRIAKIDSNALWYMNLWQLYLDGNRLTDTKFISSLPRGMSKLFLSNNEITELSNFPFFPFWRLSELHLDGNNIAVVRKNTLRGLTFLLRLDLSKNRITTLEPGCFSRITTVHWLNLRDNEISNLGGGVFNGLARLVDLDLGENSLTEITPGFRDSLPHNLEFLALDYNLLKNLQPGSFVNVPKSYLNLQGNQMSTISKGAFVVPKLYGVDLQHEPLDLSPLLGPLFFGNYLATLLSDTPLPVKQKGIGRVNLWRNSITRLEKGSLYGIKKGRDTYVYLNFNPIEFIHGGVFDEL